MGMTLNERYEINALLEDLLKNDETTFDTGKARRLIALVPLTKNGSTIEFYSRHQSHSTKGHAAGIGDVEIPGETTSKNLKFGRDEIHRVGGYKLRHNKGSLSVELMWVGTRPPEDGQTVVLKYRRPDKPVNMKLVKFHSLSLRWMGLGTFYVESYVLWKRPR